MDILEKFSKIQIALFGVILGLSIVMGAQILSNNFSKNEITITGSASEIVKSDSAVWQFQIKAESPKRIEAYNTLNRAKPIVVDFLKSKGVPENEIEMLRISDYTNYKPLSNGGMSQEVNSYVYEQMVKVSSSNVELIKELYLELPSLIEKGVLTYSNQPNYYYSKLPEKKADLLEKASADAKTRAKGMLKATNNRVGKIRSVRMGVFQITPSDSNEVSDWGINDSTTIDKKITAVANVVFAIK